MSSKKAYTLKFLVVGDSGVGKTSILVRYCQDSYQSDYLSTIGVDFKIKRIELNNNQLTLNIWDTAGQQRFRNITKSFYKGAHGIVLVYSITDTPSFEHIQSWIDQIKQNGNSDMRMILVGSKCDLQSQRKVTRKQGQQLAEKYNLEFIQTSAKQSTNVETIFKSLSQNIISKISLQEQNKQGSTTLTAKTEKKTNDSCC